MCVCVLISFPFLLFSQYTRALSLSLWLLDIPPRVMDDVMNAGRAAGEDGHFFSFFLLFFF